MLRTLGSSLLLVTAAFAQTNFPPPISPANNPQSADKVLLGMALFFEEQLSANNQVACATCHEMTSAGVDPRAEHSWNPGLDGTFGTADDQRGSPGIALLAPNQQLVGHPTHGFGEQITARRAPTVINSGYHTHLGYAGTSQSLEELIELPPVNPIEMGFAGRTWNDVTTKLAGVTPLTLATNLPARLQSFVVGNSYADLFQTVFGSTAITKERVTQAIASYIRTLNSDQSKWDLHLNNQATLTPLEQMGLQLFTTPVGNAAACSSCHSDFDSSVLQSGPIAGQMSVTTIGGGYFSTMVPTRLIFHNVGLRPAGEDIGRAQVTNDPDDRGRFKIASLRNVELAGPFFHNGAINTLEEVIEFYNQGGNGHPEQAEVITPRGYTPVEKAALVAILKTLTDPRVAAGTFPFDAPTIGLHNGNLPSEVGIGSVTQSGQLTATAPIAAMVGESQFQLTLTGVTPGTPTYLMWDTALATTPSPFNLELAVSPSFQVFGIGAASYAWTMPQTGIKLASVPIPNQPALSGQVLFAQWLVLEPSEDWDGATSNAVRIPLH